VRRLAAAANNGDAGVTSPGVAVEVQLSNGGVRGAADTVRAYYDAVNRRDVTTALAVVADDVLYEDLALYPKVRPCALGCLQAVAARCG